MSGGCAWSPAGIERLRELWNEGHSTNEIGRRMGLSKDAVVGKAHRLGLEARLSPIHRGGPVAPRKPQRIGRGVTLPPIGETGVGQAVSSAGALVSEGHAVAGVANPPAQPQPEARVAVTTRPAAPPAQFIRDPDPCSWIEGSPRGAGTIYCDAPALRGRSYCETHHARTHVRVRAQPDAEVAA